MREFVFQRPARHAGRAGDRRDIQATTRVLPHKTDRLGHACIRHRDHIRRLSHHHLARLDKIIPVRDFLPAHHAREHGGRLETEFLHVLVEAGKRRRRDLAEHRVVVHTDNRNIVRHVDSGATARIQDQDALGVVSDHDSDWRRQRANPVGDLLLLLLPTKPGLGEHRPDGDIGAAPSVNRLEERLPPQPLPALAARDAHVGEIAQAPFQKMFGHTVCDHLLIGHEGGQARLGNEMPEADNGDAAITCHAANPHIETAGDDAIALPVRQPRRILVVLPTFRREDRPGPVQLHVPGDAEQDLATVDLRGFDDEGNVGRAVALLGRRHCAKGQVTCVHCQCRAARLVVGSAFANEDFGPTHDSPPPPPAPLTITFLAPRREVAAGNSTTMFRMGSANAKPADSST